MYRWIDGQGEAPGAPGLEPRWTSSQKSVVGTAYSTSSKIWWTISHGMINEIYNPTIDKPQVRDLEFLVTDGETFVHEEKRDLKHTFSYLSKQAPAVGIVNSDPAGRYSITKEIISDPHAPVLLMRVKFAGDAELLRKMKAYALLAPHLDGGGAHNNGRVLDVAGRTRAAGVEELLCPGMAADCGFSNASCGFVGTQRRLPGRDAALRDGVALRVGDGRQHRADGRDQHRGAPGVRAGGGVRVGGALGADADRWAR